MNKIWNASRFVLMNAEDVEIKNISDCKLNVADKWIITKLNKAIREVTVNMEKYEMGIALAKLYDFVWNDFCDWYIELTKPVLYGDDEVARTDTVSVLVYVLKETVKLLHPFVPFVTQEIYSNIPGTNTDIMISEFPRYNPKFNYSKAVKDLEPVTAIIKTVRNVKAKLNVAPSKKVDLYVKTDSAASIKKCAIYIQKLAGVSEITFIKDKNELTEKTISQVLASCELYVPLGELVDAEAEKARLKKELEKCESEIARSNGKLSNKGFLDKAPKALVDGEKEKLNKYSEIKEKLILELKEFE